MITDNKTITKHKKPRCPICKKKLGLMIFTCQCEKRFCINHIQPELHECTYDHKTKQRKELKKLLPLVCAEKVIKI